MRETAIELPASAFYDRRSVRARAVVGYDHVEPGVRLVRERPEDGVESVRRLEGRDDKRQPVRRALSRVSPQSSSATIGSVPT